MKSTFVLIFLLISTCSCNFSVKNTRLSTTLDKQTGIVKSKKYTPERETLGFSVKINKDHSISSEPNKIVIPEVFSITFFISSNYSISLYDKQYYNQFEIGDYVSIVYEDTYAETYIDSELVYKELISHKFLKVEK